MDKAKFEVFRNRFYARHLVEERMRWDDHVISTFFDAATPETAVPAMLKRFAASYVAFLVSNTRLREYLSDLRSGGHAPPLPQTACLDCQRPLRGEGAGTAYAVNANGVALFFCVHCSIRRFLYDALGEGMADESSLALAKKAAERHDDCIFCAVIRGMEAADLETLGGMLKAYGWGSPAMTGAWKRWEGSPSDDLLGDGVSH